MSFFTIRRRSKMPRAGPSADKIFSRLFLAVPRPDKTNALHRTYRPLPARRFSRTAVMQFILI